MRYLPSSLTLMVISSLASSNGTAQTSQALEFTKSASCQSTDQLECERLARIIDTGLVAAKKIVKMPTLEQKVKRLELNEALELSSTFNMQPSDNSLPRQRIRSKYQQLKNLLIASESTEGFRSHTHTYSERTIQPNIAYHPLELEAVKNVFDKYGDLEIPDSEISDPEQPVWQTLQVDRPWAGYWYPRYDGILYQGDFSIFAKLDRILKKRNITSGAQAQEASYHQGVVSESWEGLCDAWSLASILVPEPTKALIIEGETLEITDQKALLTKMHEDFDVTAYGVRYDGNYESDGTYQDLRPEAFHKILVEFLGKKRKPFIIDDNADAEVWQAPVYKADWSVTKDKDVPYSYFVDARIWKIKNRSGADNRLTSREDLIYRNLQYRLYIDSDVYHNEDRRLVIAGEWLGESRKEHPDFIVIPKKDAKMGSFNPYLDDNIDFLQDLLLSNR